MNEMMQMFTQMMTMPMTVMECFTRSMQSSCPMQTCMSMPMPEPCGPVLCEPIKEEVCERRERWPVATRHCCDSGCRCDGRSCHDGCSCRKRVYQQCCDSGCRCDGRSCYTGCPCRERVYHSGSDRLKLIEFSLVTVRRGAAHVLKAGQLLVSGCTTPQEIRNMIVVGYVNEHCDQGVDGKDLRVYTRELDCWCKPEFDFEEQQIDALEGIRRAIAR